MAVTPGVCPLPLDRMRSSEVSRWFGLFAVHLGADVTGCFRHFASEPLPDIRSEREELRLPRTSRLQAMSETNKARFHMHDGPAQQQRDAQMASGATDWSLAAITWLYKHDADVVDDHT